MVVVVINKQKRDPENVGPRKFGRRYPWAKWFSEVNFTLIRGVHYTIATHGMAQMVRNRARSIPGCKVHLKVPESGTCIEVTVEGVK